MIWIITILLVVALTGCVLIYGDGNTFDDHKDQGLVVIDKDTDVDGDDDSVTDDDVLEVSESETETKPNLRKKHESN